MQSAEIAVTHTPSFALAGVLLLGIAGQWIAWRTHFPSILLLLALGLAAGPVFSFVDPNAVFGSLLMPFVSFSVAIILFEGGLGLKLSELKTIGVAVRNLVTIGAVVTWTLASLGAWLILDLELGLAVLTGSILIVTGPTVIIPLLRQVRPAGKVGPILKWEGIVIDPLGVMIAVLVFEAMLVSRIDQITLLALSGILNTLIVGTVLGILGGGLVYFVFKHYLVPDFLQNPVALTVVIVVFALSNFFQAEAGLLSVTIMGLLLANQNSVSVKSITQFKEDLRVLLISTLFIVLAARIQPEQLMEVDLRMAFYALFLICIVRPLSVFASTIGTSLSVNEKLFLSAIAPRGIVAASIASIFALELLHHGYPGANRIVPIIFFVIISTVSINGLGARAIARLLGLARPEERGILIVGANPLAREIAKNLKELGVQTLLLDTNGYNIAAAKKAGLSAAQRSFLVDPEFGDITLGGLGKAIAFTSNDEVNALAAMHFSEVFGRADVYQLPLNSQITAEQSSETSSIKGRMLFDPECNYNYLNSLFNKGGKIVIEQVTKARDYGELRSSTAPKLIPLIAVVNNLSAIIITPERTNIGAGEAKVICLAYE